MINNKLNLLDNNRYFLLETRGVAAFKYRHIIDEIIISIYNEIQKSNENVITYNTHIPGIVTNLKIEVYNYYNIHGEYVYNHTNYSHINDFGEIENEIIKIYINYKSLIFDILSLYRMIYHELNHLIEFYYTHHIIKDVTDNVLDIERIIKTFEDAKSRYKSLRFSEVANEEKFKYNLFYMFTSMFSRTEGRALVGGMYGELLYMNSF